LTTSAALAGAVSNARSASERMERRELSIGKPPFVRRRSALLTRLIWLSIKTE
jgi:hypothetical protein